MKMTSPIGWKPADASPERRTRGFTLVELVLVMAVLATVLAIAAPHLSRFFDQRRIEDETRRFLALTQFARNEAISTGMPMVLWIDPDNQEYGLESMTGYPPRAGKALSYQLHRDVRMILEENALRAQYLPDIEFRPDGTLGELSVFEVLFEDRRGQRLYLVPDFCGYGFEIQKETEYAMQRHAR